MAHQLVIEVVAGLILAVVTGALVFVVTYGTLPGPGAAPGLVNPFIVIPIATAGVGLWVLVTGSRLHDWPGWPVEGRALRLTGAYCLASSLLAASLSSLILFTSVLALLALVTASLSRLVTLFFAVA